MHPGLYAEKQGHAKKLLFFMWMWCVSVCVLSINTFV